MKGLLNGEPARFDFAEMADERAGLCAVQVVEALAEKPIAKHLDGREVQTQRLEFANEAANKLQLLVTHARLAAIVAGVAISTVAVVAIAVVPVAVQAVDRLRCGLLLHRLRRAGHGLTRKLLLNGLLERVPELGGFGGHGSNVAIGQFDLDAGGSGLAAVLLLPRNFLAVRRVKLDHGNLLEGFEELQSRKLSAFGSCSGGSVVNPSVLLIPLLASTILVGCSQGNSTAPNSAASAGPASRPAPSDEEVRSFKNNVRREAEDSKPDFRDLKQDEWLEAVKNVWSAKATQESMKEALLATRGSPELQEQTLKTLYKRAESADETMGMEFAHVGAKRAIYVICMRRIREVLGEERTDRILKELAERK